jgi:hypothetical protein
MIFKLVQTSTIESGEFLMDKEEGIIYYNNILDWFKLMESYNECEEDSRELA